MSTRQITAAPAAAVLNAPSAAAQVFAQLLNATLAAALNVPGTKRLEGRKFYVRASGVVTTSGAAITVQPFIAAGSSLTAASDTVLAAPAAVTVAATSCPWTVEAALLFDSTSGKLNGQFSSNINNSVGAPAALATVLTGLNGVNEPVFQIVTGVTFSTAGPGNIATLTEFVLEE